MGGHGEKQSFDQHPTSASSEVTSSGKARKRDIPSSKRARACAYAGTYLEFNSIHQRIMHDPFMSLHRVQQFLRDPDIRICDTEVPFQVRDIDGSTSFLRKKDKTRGDRKGGREGD